MPSIGIDVGSTAAKAAVFENGRLAETLVCPTGFSSVDAAVLPTSMPIEGIG